VARARTLYMESYILQITSLQIMDPIQQKVVNAEILVMDCQSTAILGHASATALNLLRTGPEMINNINETPAITNLVQKYKDRFLGLGNVKDAAVKVHTDPSLNSSNLGESVSGSP